MSSTDITSRGRDLERERDFRCGSSLGTWRYWVLGMAVWYGCCLSAGQRLRTVVVHDEDSMWDMGMSERSEGRR